MLEYFIYECFSGYGLFLHSVRTIKNFFWRKNYIDYFTNFNSIS